MKKQKKLRILDQCPCALKVALALIPELSNDGKGQDPQYPGWSQGPSPGI